MFWFFTLGKWSNLTCTYFSDGLVQPQPLGVSSQWYEVTWVIKEASKKIRRPLLVRTLDETGLGEMYSKVTISIITYKKMTRNHMKSSICHWNDASFDWVGWKHQVQRLCFRFVFPKKTMVSPHKNGIYTYTITLCNCKIALKSYIFPKVPHDSLDL